MSAFEIKLALTAQQAETIMDAIANYRDCGPTGEGWQSAELAEAAELVREAIEAARLA